MKGYKGFDKDLICRDFQYEIGKTYETDEAKLSEKGFHFCEAPLDVLNYYPVVDNKCKMNRFCEVEADDVSDEKGVDSKRVSRKLKIGAEIGLPGLIKAHVEYVKEQTKECDDAAQIGSSGDDAQIGSSGRYAQIGSSGRYAQIGSSGRYAQIGSSGDAAQIGSSGRYAQIGSSGDAAKIGSSGRYAQIGSSGDAAQIGSSGDAAKIGSSGDAAKIGSSGDAAQIGSSGRYAQIGSSGRYAQIGSSGDDAQIICESDHAVVVCAGKRARIKAPVGTWITLSEYGDYDGEGYPCLCVKSAKIDGERIKADTWYTLRNSEFVEVDE